MPFDAHVTAQLCPWSGQPSKYYMDVTMYPISEDLNHGSGLCGSYNGDPNEDQMPAVWMVSGSGPTSIYGEIYHVPLLFPPSNMYFRAE